MFTHCTWTSTWSACRDIKEIEGEAVAAGLRLKEVVRLSHSLAPRRCWGMRLSLKVFPVTVAAMHSLPCTSKPLAL